MKAHAHGAATEGAALQEGFVQRFALCFGQNVAGIEQGGEARVGDGGFGVVDFGLKFGCLGAVHGGRRNYVLELPAIRLEIGLLEAGCVEHFVFDGVEFFELIVFEREIAGKDSERSAAEAHWAMTPEAAWTAGAAWCAWSTGSVGTGTARSCLGHFGGAMIFNCYFGALGAGLDCHLRTFGDWAGAVRSCKGKEIAFR